MENEPETDQTTIVHQDSARELALKTYTLYFIVAAIILGTLFFLALKRTSKLCCWNFIYGVRKRYPKEDKDPKVDTLFRSPSILTTLQQHYNRKQSVRSQSSMRSTVALSEVSFGDPVYSESHGGSSRRSRASKSRVHRYVDTAGSASGMSSFRMKKLSEGDGDDDDKTRLVQEISSGMEEENYGTSDASNSTALATWELATESRAVDISEINVHESTPEVLEADVMVPEVPEADMMVPEVPEADMMVPEVPEADMMVPEVPEANVMVPEVPEEDVTLPEPDVTLPEPDVMVPEPDLMVPEVPKTDVTSGPDSQPAIGYLSNNPQDYGNPESESATTSEVGDSRPSSSFELGIVPTEGDKFGTYASIGKVSIPRGDVTSGRTSHVIYTHERDTEIGVSMDTAAGGSSTRSKRLYRKNESGTTSSARSGSHRAIKKVIGIL